MIPVFIAIDDNYSKYAATCIESLVDHTNKNNNYVINVVYESLSEENKNKLSTLAKDNCKIKFIPIDDKVNVIENKEGHFLRAEKFTLTIFFRIFIPDMFKEYDKGIYIDADTILNDDIANLYNIDLEDNLIGACIDKSTIENKIIGDYFENYVGINKYKYFNSGVLLMDLKGLREKELTKNFIHLLTTYDFDTVAPDQDYLNSMLFGKVKFLEDKWNSMPIDKNGKEIENPSLIHYNLFLKPWHHRNCDYNKYYWNYANKSIYKEDILKELNSYTEEDIKNDYIGFNHMEQKIIDIQNECKISFKSIFDEGKETRIS